MKLKFKFVLGSLLILIIFLILSLSFYQLFIKSVFFNLEKVFVEEKVKQFVTYLKLEEENLLGFTKDWAAWTEAYLFLKGKNPNFPKNNLTLESWINNKVSILLYLDKKGNPIAGGFYDPKVQKILPVDKNWVKKHFDKFSEFNPRVTPQTGYTGFSFYKEIPCIVVVHSVTDSNFKASPIGFLIVARMFDQKALQLWEKLFNFHKIKFAKDFKSGKKPWEFYFKDNFYEINIFLEDFLKNSFLKISFQIFKIFLLEGYFVKLICFQLFVLLFFFLMFFFYFKEAFIERLLTLVKQIRELKEGRRKELEVRKKDEIALIAEELNKLYEKIEAQIKEIEEAKKIYQIIAEKANLLVGLLDENRNIIYLNPLAKKYLNSERIKEILNQSEMERNSQFRVYSLNGIFLQVEVIPIKDFSNYCLLIGYDVTAFKEKIDQLFEFSIKDFLTGLYNRRYLEEVLKKLHSMVKREKEEYAILFIDLDDLKKINDAFGHLKGDEVLKKVAKVIKESVRESDWVGRWGGDEFLVLIKGSIEEAKVIAERLLQEIRKLRFVSEEKEFSVSVSIGISSLREDIKVEEAIKLADQMAYEAKRSGKAGIKVN